MESTSENIQKVERCNFCFANIYNDSDHICDPDGIKASYRRAGGVYANAPYPLFDVWSADLYYLNPIGGTFEMVCHGQQLLSPATDGIISFKKGENLCVATYEATSLKKCAIIFAAIKDDQCQMLFRIATSPDRGLEFFMLDSTLTLENGRFNMPIEYRMNTAMILGITSESTSMVFRVYANSTGAIEIDNFNGYSTACLINSAVNSEVNILDR